MSEEVAKRGRKPIEIDTVEFQAVVTRLEQEKEGGFSNRTQLWEAVSETEWAKTRQPRPLTPQVSMMKAEEFKLVIQTPKGKRGRVKGQKPPTSGGRKKKSFSLPMLESGVPVEEREGLKKTLEKAAAGSLKARIRLKCLECTNWQPVEIRNCEGKNCPLWDVRPYKNAKNLKSNEEETAELVQKELTAN